MSQAEDGREQLLSEAFVGLVDSLVDDYDVIDVLDRLVGYSVLCWPPTPPASCWSTPTGTCRWWPPPGRSPAGPS